jgi:truncated hemoglobin YjbI
LARASGEAAGLLVFRDAGQRPLQGAADAGSGRITPAAFARWLELWGETTNELLPPDTAAAMQDRAWRIAESLSLGIQFYQSRLVELAATRD